MAAFSLLASCTMLGVDSTSLADQAVAEVEQRELEARVKASLSGRLSAIQIRTGRWTRLTSKQACAVEAYGEDTDVDVAISVNYGARRTATANVTVCVDSEGDVHVQPRGVVFADPTATHVRVTVHYNMAVSARGAGKAPPSAYVNVDPQRAIKKLKRLDMTGMPMWFTHDRATPLELGKSFVLEYELPKPSEGEDTRSDIFTVAPEWENKRLASRAGGMADVEFLHVFKERPQERPQDSADSDSQSDDVWSRSLWKPIFDFASRRADFDRKRSEFRRSSTEVPELKDDPTGDPCIKRLRELDIPPAVVSSGGKATVYSCVSPALDSLADLRSLDLPKRFAVTLQNVGLATKSETPAVVLKNLVDKDPSLDAYVRGLLFGVQRSSPTASAFGDYLAATEKLLGYLYDHKRAGTSQPVHSALLDAVTKLRQAIREWNASFAFTWPRVIVRSEADAGKPIKIRFRYLSLFGEGPDRSYVKDLPMKVPDLEIWRPGALKLDDFGDTDDDSPLTVQTTRVSAGFEQTFHEDIRPPPPPIRGGTFNSEEANGATVLIGKSNASSLYFANTLIWVFRAPSIADCEPPPTNN